MDYSDDYMGEEQKMPIGEQAKTDLCSVCGKAKDTDPRAKKWVGNKCATCYHREWARKRKKKKTKSKKEKPKQTTPAKPAKQTLPEPDAKTAEDKIPPENIVNIDNVIKNALIIHDYCRQLIRERGKNAKFPEEIFEIDKNAATIVKECVL